MIPDWLFTLIVILIAVAVAGLRQRGGYQPPAAKWPQPITLPEGGSAVQWRWSGELSPEGVRRIAREEAERVAARPGRNRMLTR